MHYDYDLEIEKRYHPENFEDPYDGDEDEDVEE